jgi:hypothetical protein
MGINEGKKEERGKKQTRMNNNLPLLLKGHRVAIVFKMGRA